MPMWQWHYVDGTVDNEVGTRAEEPDTENVRAIGHSVREAGWDQVAHWTPGAPGSGAWPPNDEIVSVKLTRGQWRWVASVLDDWSQVANSIEHWEEARGQRAVRDLIRSRLTL